MMKRNSIDKKYDIYMHTYIYVDARMYSLFI